MEFYKKLYALRKGKGLTQEELGQVLHVSRSAISKWESGRGYPGIDSIKAIAQYFAVTIDELLSCDEIISIAVDDQHRKRDRFCALVFALLDISVLLFMFVPVFGMPIDGYVYAVSMPLLRDIPVYLKIAYYGFVSVMAVSGILTLALRDDLNDAWHEILKVMSLVINAGGTLLFIICSEPYAAAVCFVYLCIKAVLLLKKR